MNDWEPLPELPPERRQISSMQFVFVGILAVGLLLALNLSDRIAEGQRIQADRQRVEQDIINQEHTQVALQATLGWVQNPAFVEAWARSEGKLVRSGEVLVVPIPAGEAILPTPTPTPIPPQQDPVEEPWTVWWKLFFDEPPPEFD